MFTKISVAALLASLAAAQHVPTTGPSGNPIHSPLTESVPACVPYTITWTPTTPNTVSLILLKGPSPDKLARVDGPAIAVGIANSGSLVYTFPSTLEASPDKGGYGIQLIDDVTGQFQYSNNFGINKAQCGATVSSSAVSSKVASSTGGYPVSTMKSSSATPVTTMKTSCSTVATSYPMKNTTVIYSTMPVVSTYTPVYPTETANSTTSRLPQATGAASALQAGAGLVGAVAALALMI